MIETIIILIVFGLGYTLGRRAGSKQGRQLGLVQAFIDLRINALEQGTCPICHCNFATGKNEHAEV